MVIWLRTELQSKAWQNEKRYQKAECRGAYAMSLGTMALSDKDIVLKTLNEITDDLADIRAELAELKGSKTTKTKKPARVYKLIPGGKLPGATELPGTAT